MTTSKGFLKSIVLIGVTMLILATPIAAQSPSENRTPSQSMYLIDRTYRGINRMNPKVSFMLGFSSGGSSRVGAWVSKTFSDHFSGMIGYRHYLQSDFKHGVDIGASFLHYYDPETQIAFKGRYEVFATQFTNGESIMRFQPTWMLSRTLGKTTLFFGGSLPAVLKDNSETYSFITRNRLFVGAELPLSKKFSLLTYIDDDELGLGFGRGLPIQLAYNQTTETFLIRLYHPYWQL